MLIYKIGPRYDDPNCNSYCCPGKSCRSLDFNASLSSNTPFAHYQNQKIIQRTVRIDSSQYTMNLGALASYQKPIKLNAYVPWNQMSDRAVPSVQKAVTGSGTNVLSGNSRKRTLTRLRPGAMSPGGVGCDIKHNSYERYLNRIKAKGPLRRGVVPPIFDKVKTIQFNRANPIFGGKIMKTNIVAGCDCPIVLDNQSYKLYKEPQKWYPGINKKPIFEVGDAVLLQINDCCKHGVIIQALGDNNFVVEIDHEVYITINSFYFLNEYECYNCDNNPNILVKYPHEPCDNNSDYSEHSSDKSVYDYDYDYCESDNDY